MQPTVNRVTDKREERSAVIKARVFSTRIGHIIFFSDKEIELCVCKYHCQYFILFEGKINIFIEVIQKYNS